MMLMRCNSADKEEDMTVQWEDRTVDRMRWRFEKSQ